jgi:ketosteroid isomerase-like protein
VKSSGDLAFEVGKWSNSIDGRRSVGNYLALWRLVGSSWLRAGSCSVPESGANPVVFGDPGRVFGGTRASTNSGGVRLIGGGGAAETAAKIQELTGRYAEVFNSGNGRAVGDFASALYTSDAVVMLPEAELLVGEQSIALACEMAAAAVSNVSIQVSAVEVGTSGDLAFVLATYYNDVQAATGEVVPSNGNYLSVWSREGEQWKIAGSCVGDMGGTPEIGYALKRTSP